ncbi:MAG TPA: VOC family protein [Thermoplasmata archaeon]|nr:VOC family protein [Thermoplasmata archaeon]
MVQKPNSVVHVEIHSNEPEKTKTFLKDVFNWKFEEMPAMNYSTFEPPSAPGGGLQKADNMPAGVLDYILSENIENTLKKIQNSGGAVVMPKTEIPGFGWFAVFQDPTGITLALYEASMPPARARRTQRKATKAKARGGRKASRRSR